MAENKEGGGVEESDKQRHRHHPHKQHTPTTDPLKHITPLLRHVSLPVADASLLALKTATRMMRSNSAPSKARRRNCAWCCCSCSKCSTALYLAQCTTPSHASNNLFPFRYFLFSPQPTCSRDDMNEQARALQKQYQVCVCASASLCVSLSLYCLLSFIHLSLSLFLSFSLPPSLPPSLFGFFLLGAFCLFSQLPC